MFETDAEDVRPGEDERLGSDAVKAVCFVTWTSFAEDSGELLCLDGSNAVSWCTGGRELELLA